MSPAATVAQDLAEADRLYRIGHPLPPHLSAAVYLDQAIDLEHSASRNELLCRRFAKRFGWDGNGAGVVSLRRRSSLDAARARECYRLAAAWEARAVIPSAPCTASSTPSSPSRS